MIENFLQNRDVDYEVIRHELAYTAQETAAADDVSGYEFAKTVIVTDGQEHYMLVLPAPFDVDMEGASDLIGQEVRLASEEETEPLFPECEVGAEPPFGSAFHMLTFMDESMEGEDHIVFRGGNHEKTIKMSTADYIQVEEPTVGEFAVPRD